MSDAAFLRERARAAVQNGKLPARHPDRMWNGPGIGALCTICELPVRRDELELEFEGEIQFEHDGGSPGLDYLHVHLRCFSAWECERRSAGETSRTR